MTSSDNEETRSRHAGLIGNFTPDTRLLVLWPGGHADVALVDGATLVLGRGMDCDLRIDAASVSRRHAEVQRRGGVITIADLGSAHGVVVGVDKLELGQRAQITWGDGVKLGDAVLVVQGAPTAAPRNNDVAASQTPNLEALTTLVAKSHLNIVLHGETGAGKEVLARKLHDLSPRAGGPFVRINCAAFPESTVDAELFGYEKGAFTGAVASKPGLIESAQGGTLLLDEVAELPPSTQAKLLRAVGNLEVLRLGSVAPRTIDVRFFAASHANLSDLATQGRFRPDLWFRLNGITLTVAPLRERRSEIAALAQGFAEELAQRSKRPNLRLDPSTISRLTAYAWPGNIRELKSTVERACAICSDDLVTERDIVAAWSLAGGPTVALAPAVPRALKDDLAMTEKKRIEEALVACHGNQTRAAELLGLSRRALVYKIEQYGLPRPRK